MFLFPDSPDEVIQAKIQAEKRKAKADSARAVMCRCPECGKPSSTYTKGMRKIVNCPNCGVLTIDRETGDVSKLELNSDFR